MSTSEEWASVSASDRSEGTFREREMKEVEEVIEEWPELGGRKQTGRVFEEVGSST